MKRMFAGGTCLAGVLALSMAALAQSGQPPTQPPAEADAPAAQEPAAQEMKAPAQPVTIVGCVHKESDYRSARNLGKGGAVGTGVGAGDEFVLINASTPAAVGTPPAPVGTSGAVGNEEYEMTGSSEEQLTSFVGRRVEITGTLKAAETKPTGATGGVTEAVPGSRDLKLREVEIASVKEATGTCPPLARIIREGADSVRAPRDRIGMWSSERCDRHASPSRGAATTDVVLGDVWMSTAPPS